MEAAGQSKRGSSHANAADHFDRLRRLDNIVLYEIKTDAAGFYESREKSSKAFLESVCGTFTGAWEAEARSADDRQRGTR
jgi:hypothetical protein